jgi:hypothetical protein
MNFPNLPGFVVSDVAENEDDYWVTVETASAPPPPLSNQDSSVLRPLDQNTIAGYTVLKDIYGRPGLILKVSSPRAG